MTKYFSKTKLREGSEGLRGTSKCEMKCNTGSAIGGAALESPTVALDQAKATDTLLKTQYFIFRRILVCFCYRISAYFWFDGNGRASFCDFPCQRLIACSLRKVLRQGKRDIDSPKLYQPARGEEFDTTDVHLLSKLLLPIHK